MAAADDKYASQKKYLTTKKQLRVWVDPDKYDALKQKAKINGTSVYALVNEWVDQYLKRIRKNKLPDPLTVSSGCQGGLHTSGVRRLPSRYPGGSLRSCPAFALMS